MYSTAWIFIFFVIFIETDLTLLDDAQMRPIAIKYAQDEAAFFADYATVRYGPPFLYIHL